MRFRLPRQDATEGDRLPALSPDGNRALFLFHGALLKGVLYRAEAEGGGGATGLYLLDFE
jgi:hypothetical protein